MSKSTTQQDEIRELLNAIQRVQDLVGRAKGAAMNDRNPNRMTSILSPLSEAFEICVKATALYPSRSK